MSRVYTSSNDPLDFCNNCYPATEEEAFELYGNVGDGPDGRGNCFGYEAEHPDYVSEGYSCITCHELLQDEDN